MSYDVVTVGEILVEVLSEKVDQVFYKPGKLLGPYPSGAPAIAIDQAARMGAKTAIFAKVGEDDFAKVNLDRLSEDGVDVSHVVKTVENTTGTAFVTYFADGNRKFIYHFSKAACGELAPQDIDDEIIKNTKVLHIMGCSITASKSLGESVMHCVRTAKKNHVLISFDPNIRPELLTGQIMDYYREIIDACDILLTGRSELRLLYKDEYTGVDALLQQRDRIVVVKDGSRGTNVFTRKDAFTVPVYPAQEVDPTGAGDCFDGTFLSLIVNGTGLKTAVSYGNAAGALAIQKRGPMEGNSSKEDLECFIQKSGFAEATDIENWYKE